MHPSDDPDPPDEADEDPASDAFFGDLIAAVDQQIASPATHYVAQAHARLVREGLGEDEAKELIAACLAEESDRMFRSRRPFDERAYRERLDHLPGEGA